MKQKPIIIAGAGPVGLTLAYLFIQAGFSVIVLEKQSAISQDLRATTIHPGVLELYKPYAIIDKIINSGLKSRELQYWDSDTNSCLAKFNYDLIANDTDYPFRLYLGQDKFIKILYESLIKQPLCQILFNAEISTAKEIDDAVEVTYQHEKQTHSINGALLIGADGASSFVRQKILNFPFPGETYANRRLTIDIKNFDMQRYFPGNQGNCFFIGKAFGGAVLQVSSELVRIGFELPCEILEEEQVTPSLIQTILKPILPNSILESLEIVRKVFYRSHQRIVKYFGQDRILLAGDAAHLNVPIGGLGLNTGLQDAFLLAKAVIALIHDHDASLSLTYCQQRAKAVIEHTLNITSGNHSDLDTQSDISAIKNKYQKLAKDTQMARKFLLTSSLLLTSD